MNTTGIIRKVDELGRIVLPIEIRRNLEIQEKDPLEIFVKGNQIILRKYNPSCIFCGNADAILIYMEKNICPTCLAALETINRDLNRNIG